MTTRQALGRQELIELPNLELAAYDECAGCRFASIHQLSEPDEVGSSWWDAQVLADHRLGLEEHFILRHVVEETRGRFDVRVH